MQKNAEEIITLGGNLRDFDEARETEAAAWIRWIGQTTRVPVLGLKGYSAKGEVKMVLANGRRQFVAPITSNPMKLQRPAQGARTETT
ncbi:hypothetical protein KXR64_20510 [Brucella intermedia]|uniref:hypothetical protein n=1 Tax=Brucella TaxID=234 RepID=UPI00094623AF|nr:hypothetical protein [Brucella intermedia]